MFVLSVCGALRMVSLLTKFEKPALTAAAFDGRSVHLAPPELSGSLIQCFMCAFVAFRTHGGAFESAFPTSVRN